MTAPRTAVEIPTPVVTPARFGLLSVAPATATGPHEHHGITWEESPAAAQARTVTGWCPPTTLDLDDEDYAGVPWAWGSPITVYATFDCKAVGRDIARAQQTVSDRLAVAAPRALERAVWTGKDSTGADTGAKTLRGADVLAGGDAVDLIGAIGLLEEWIGDNYGGAGVIHSPRKVGAAPARLSVVGQHMETALGTSVAFYTGSPNTGPDGAVADDGQAWLYVTGQVLIRQGPDQVVPEDVAQGFGYTTNDVIALAMRPYTVAWETGPVAVLANLPTNY